MSNKLTRRDFIKKLGGGAVVATAAAATVTLPKLKRSPDEGDRCRLWGPPTTTCLNCNAENEIDIDIYGIYAGQQEEAGDLVHVFLIENAMRCVHCRQRVTKYTCEDVNFVELNDGKV